MNRERSVIALLLLAAVLCPRLSAANGDPDVRRDGD